ncbi:hypothetical protein [uncultured Aquimarina sp.]|uniref:hypothetical protein n=1 Tax=uncultured Aquimarina sp. TaxID=575652 RepID=UPI0026235A15|nr:hypothetical protein [uncultured Aquimarina sp.]
MKIRILTLILVSSIIFFTNCSENDEDNIQPKIEGKYTGTFERNGQTTNVELNFIDGTYSGESEVEKFPAICNGNFSISDNSIEFENICVWTAEFDWTLILSDKWNYKIENNILTITKSNGDKYTLTKK